MGKYVESAERELILLISLKKFNYASSVMKEKTLRGN